MASRREMLRNSSLILAGATFAPSFSLWDFNKKQQFRIGACDWSIGKTSDITGLSLAKEIGLQGLQVSLGTLNNNMHLRQKSLQQEYLDLSKSTGVKRRAGYPPSWVIVATMLRANGKRRRGHSIIKIGLRYSSGTSFPIVKTPA